MSLRTNSSTNERKQLHKTGVDADKARSRREDSLAEIRKNTREENLLKKRIESLSVESGNLLYDAKIPKKMEKHICKMRQRVWSDEPTSQLQSTAGIEKLLSFEPSPIIDELIKGSLIPRFLEFLGRDDLPQLQSGAAWALTIIIASETSKRTQLVMERGAVPMFVRLLDSVNDDVREQAAWALCNIAGDSPSCRDFVLGQGALMPLLAQLNEHSKLSMLRNAAHTLAIFCHCKPICFEQVKPALPILRQLMNLDDEEVLKDACWAVSYLSDGESDNIQAVIEAGFCQVLLKLLSHLSPAILRPALQIVSNIATGTNSQIQVALESNIILPLLHLLQNSELDLDIRSAAGRAILEVISGSSQKQIQFLVSQGCIKALCDVLMCPDLSILTVCLEGLEIILEVGEAEMGMNGGVNLYVQMIEKCSGLDKIKDLEDHENDEIDSMANSILGIYWMDPQLKAKLEKYRAREKANPILEKDEEDISDEVLDRYAQQIEESGGFDVDYFPGETCCMIQPLTLDNKSLEEFSRYAKLAINEYNKHNGSNYEFLEVEKANGSSCLNSNYYITFKAHEDGGASTTFQALVQDLFDEGGEFNLHVDFCRIKPTMPKQKVSTSPSTNCSTC